MWVASYFRSPSAQLQENSCLVVGSRELPHDVLGFRGSGFRGLGFGAEVVCWGLLLKGTCHSWQNLVCTANGLNHDLRILECLVLEKKIEIGTGEEHGSYPVGFRD